MLCISIGTNCVPKYQIEKHLKQPKQTHFFDKTYENFSAVVNVMKNLETPSDFLQETDFVVVKKNYINTKIRLFFPHENHAQSLVVKTKFSCIEANQNIQTLETYTPTVVQTYIEKMNHMKEAIKNNNKIVFLHYVSEESLSPYTSLIKFVTENALNESVLNYVSSCAKSISQYLPSLQNSLNITHLFDPVPYFPTKDDVNEFFECIKSINANCDAHIFFIIPPEISEYFDKANLLKEIPNVNVCFLTRVGNNGEDQWKKSEYDWNIVFDQIKNV
jgi:hypothetical protein